MHLSTLSNFLVGGASIVSASTGSTLYDMLLSNKPGLPIEPNGKGALIKVVNSFSNAQQGYLLF